MSVGPKAGLTAALERSDAAARLRETIEAREGGGTQGDLLSAEDGAEEATEPGLLPVPGIARRGPGRRPGSLNKRTLASAEYLMRRYGDPVEGLLSLGMGDVAELAVAVIEIAARTGIPRGDLTVMDLLVFKRQCMEASLPYVRARLAPVDDKGQVAVPRITIAATAGYAERVEHAGLGAAGDPPRRHAELRSRFEKAQYSQGDSVDRVERSHDVMSHEDSQVIDIIEETGG